MEWIAHRGAAYDAPENSLEAFERAIGQSAPRVEVDVQISADGVLFIHHDADTTRCGDRRLVIGTSTADELRAVRLANGEGLPTFDETCRLVAGRAELDVELKATSLVMVSRVLAALSSHGLLERALVTSFHAPSLAEARRLGYAGRLGLIVGSRSLKPSQRLFEAWPLRAMRRCGADALALHHKLAHAPLVRSLRASGTPLYLWAALEDEAAPAAERARLYQRMLTLAPAGAIVARVAEARATPFPVVPAPEAV